jgi:hypothetical protein
MPCSPWLFLFILSCFLFGLNVLVALDGGSHNLRHVRLEILKFLLFYLEIFLNPMLYCSGGGKRIIENHK